MIRVTLTDDEIREADAVADSFEDCKSASIQTKKHRENRSDRETHRIGTRCEKAVAKWSNGTYNKVPNPLGGDGDRPDVVSGKGNGVEVKGVRVPSWDFLLKNGQTDFRKDIGVLVRFHENNPKIYDVIGYFTQEMWPRVRSVIHLPGMGSRIGVLQKDLIPIPRVVQ